MVPTIHLYGGRQLFEQRKRREKQEPSVISRFVVEILVRNRCIRCGHYSAIPSLN